MALPAKRTVGLGDKAAAAEAPQPKRVSKLLRAAALAHVSDELAGMPENQDMLVFLPVSHNVISHARIECARPSPAFSNPLLPETCEVA
jgi:hypothetical protein